MNIADYIQELRPKINHNWDSDVISTVKLPYDFYRAVEYGIRTLGKHAPYILRTALIPFVNQVRYYPIDLDTYEAKGFEYAKVQKIYFMSAEGYIGELTEKEIEAVESGQYVDYFYLAQKAGTLISSQYLDEQPVLGSAKDVATVPANNQITIDDTTGLDTTYYVLNLSKGNENRYSSSQISSVDSGTQLTLVDNVKLAPYNWVVGDRIYISVGQPVVIAILYQGVVQRNYFDTTTRTVIPIQDKYVEEMECCVLKYLYEILKGRFPKQYLQLWATQNKLESLAITEAKKLSSSRTSLTKVEHYVPYND